jgi:hypothetical protein
MLRLAEQSEQLADSLLIPDRWLLFLFLSLFL